jgi:transcriptional regulator with XRE-family HTH domain
MMDAPQIRAARAMLGLTQAELAKRAKISVTGLNNIESGQSDPRASTLEAIQSALELAGAEFFDGAVRLRSFRVGVRVKYRIGRAPDRTLWHAAGEVIEIEQPPFLRGAARIRAKIVGVETAWTTTSDFEFAAHSDDGVQTKVKG